MSNNPSTIPRGSVRNVWMLGVTLSPVSVAATTTAEQTFTVTGVRIGDFVDVNKPTAQAGLGIVGSRVSASDVLAITFVNVSGSAITPTASETYVIAVSRAENRTFGNWPQPTNVPSA